jgi:O-methyltransferase
MFYSYLRRPSKAVKYLSSVAKAVILSRTSLRKAKRLLTVKPYTMISYPRLSALYDAALSLDRQSVPGAVVECGVCNGGSAAILATPALRDPKRHIWLFDSWEGLPEPTQYDVSCHGKRGEKGMDLGSEETVKSLLFGKIRLSQKQVHLRRGWFNDTIPIAKPDIGKIALLHLDCDWYESVKFCLDTLLDAVVDGGFVFIDDYGHWAGCKKAVDEFLAERHLRVTVVRIDYTGVFFKK